ncbi:YbaK/EbsC family protein [uncultured Paenibacillus sp.]|uniref:YbaK/EbsC family protein n=1 Tax=uncultured Paenibacillus sp. TaxID=227322 RepID=UPI0015A8EFE5|nr:YbaK/EbsC family protein [uncultured Paenibacillus sp.]
MSIENVRSHLRQFGREQDIREFSSSSASVELAAAVLGVIPARIAKTLSFRGEGEQASLLVVSAGDAKTDNKKFREHFGFKPRMLTLDEVLAQTGHAVGGVCPFGLAHPLPVYLDVSLQRFETVFPACGSSNSAIELNCEDMYRYAAAQGWVDVCKDWAPEANTDVEKENVS